MAACTGACRRRGCAAALRRRNFRLAIFEAGSPQPKQDANPQPSGQNKSFIGYVTSRSIVFPDIATNPLRSLPAVIQDLCEPGHLSRIHLGSGVSAAINQATTHQAPPVKVGKAYGTRVGYSMARASSTSFFGTFVSLPCFIRILVSSRKSHPGFLARHQIFCRTYCDHAQ